MKKMASYIAIASVSVSCAACGQRDNGVRVTNAGPEKPQATAAVTNRSEPVFYNGKTYHLDFAGAADGSYRMTVKGMTAKQGKDAVAVATSALRYFACPDGKTGKLTDNPSYAGGLWALSARCG